MAFKFRIRKPRFEINIPSQPAISDIEDEALTGMVQNMKASEPEERFARALSKAGLSYQFRMTVGAPRGLPGWKELDFLISSGSLLYAYEVDTAFTHREKAYADVLHDAIVLNDPEIQTLGELYPEVKHVDGDSDLASSQNAESYVRHQFGTRG